MERLDYPAQRVELLRRLATSIGAGPSQAMVLRLASDCEKRARYKLDALNSLRNRISDQ